MQTILSESDFRGEVNVAGTEQTAVLAELNRFIQLHERAFMAQVLGYDLSEALYGGLAEETPDQRWVDLLNGVVWVDSDTNVNWTGLKTCAANYVYFHYMRNLASLTTTSGEKIAEADNATAVQVNMKAVHAWNRMSKQLADMWDYVSTVKDDDGDLLYTEWDNGRGINYQKFRPINQFGI